MTSNNPSYRLRLHSPLLTPKHCTWSYDAGCQFAFSRMDRYHNKCPSIVLPRPDTWPFHLINIISTKIDYFFDITSTETDYFCVRPRCIYR